MQVTDRINSSVMTRRMLLGSLGAAATLTARPSSRVEWKPKLGILGPYTPANVDFAKTQGFSNMILAIGPTLDPVSISDAQIENVRTTLEKAQMHVSAFQFTLNHIDPNAQAARKKMCLSSKPSSLPESWAFRTLGRHPAKTAAKPFHAQVDEIVRVYNEKYFPACERNHVRILWEPWPEGPNLATSPVGFAALFKGFGNSPYVGLQYDPSHLVRQFMDPIQTARDFVDKIYDVHLKDTEILWPVLRAGGITPVDDASWWRYRIPGLGSINWARVLQRAAGRGLLRSHECRT